MDDFESYLEEQMRNPEFVKAYEKEKKKHPFPWEKSKKEITKEYRKAQIDTVKRMYDNRIFIDYFGTIDYEMYSKVTGLSEKKVRKLLQKFHDESRDRFYHECKKRYKKNSNALLVRLFYSYLPLRFIAKKLHMQEEEIPDEVSRASDESKKNVWYDLIHKIDRTEREEQFCRNYVICKKLQLIAQTKYLYESSLSAGNTVEEALEYASVDKVTIDKYLSMNQEETEQYAQEEVNVLFKSNKK